MIPVTQTIFHNDLEGRVGNCLQAVIASVTEKSLEEVPHFAAMADDVWFDNTCNFLNEHGFNIYDCEIEEVPHVKENYVLVVGKSPRGVSHVVIYQNGQLVHDPHPSRAGILDITWSAVLTQKAEEKL
jgi:hypothetical protein